MVLVTGGNGFLGSWLICHLIDSGQQVRGLLRATASMAEFESISQIYFPSSEQRAAKLTHLEWVVGDLLDLGSLEDAMQGCTIIYHTAALVSFLQKDKAKLMQMNLEGTSNVVNTAQAMGIKKLGYVSSIAALGREKPGDLITEKNKWSLSKYNSNYAISKHQAEMEVMRGVVEGLPAVMVNPGVIVGPGNWAKGTCKIFMDIWKGLPVYTKGVNGYVDVRDVCKALIMLTESEISGERYIMVGESISFETYFKLIAKHLGCKPPRWYANSFISQLAWRADAIICALTGKKPLVTKEMATAAHNICYYSSEKLIQQGFTFTPIEESIAFACKHFLETQKK